MIFAEDELFLREEYFTGSREDDYLFGGVEWMPCRWVTFLGEVFRVNDHESGFNFGARFSPVEELSVDMFLLEDTIDEDHDFGWGLSYQIDF